MLEIGDMAFQTDKIVLIIGIILVSIIAKLISDWVVKHIFVEYPDDTKESMRLIFTVLIIYVGITLLVYIIITNSMFLLVMLALLTITVLYTAKDFIKDFFTRISLLTVKAFGIGDYIDVIGQKGRVLKIGSLYTMLRRDDNSIICIPNEIIVRSMVINYTKADYIKLQESFTVNVEEQDITKVYSRITEELDIFGYRRAKILHSQTPEGMRFAVTINLEDAASISNDTSNLHKALNIVRGEFVSD
ncbi:mechanosensitive ion channel domain-containing protein [Methanooceanicella nereidis]|uniref:mechanosensitive ion channel domain-containing protein n=1 Tax=Methanooceanicella nereidis TaxID=2052831 RepID=UPI001E53DD47